MEITRLIERCRQGDAEALDELYKAYARKMKGVCRGYVSDEQTVDDILHDAFVIIFTSFDRLRDAQKAESWMMAITRNVASKYKDHLNAAPTVPLEEAEKVPASGEEATVRGIPLDEVMQMIDRLPEGYANVFRLSVFEGLSHKEIAALLGIEPHSSSSQLARAKKMLRKLLARYRMLWLLPLLLPVALYFYTRNKPTEEELQSTATKPSAKEPTSPDEPSRPVAPNPQTAIGSDQHYTADTTIPADTLRHTTEQRERADTAAVPPEQPNPDIRHHKNVNIAETKRYPIVPTPKSKPAHWGFGFTYSGLFSRSADTTSPTSTWGPGSDQSSAEPEKWRAAHHDQPFTVALTLRRQIAPRWAVETGINYTRLSSQFTTEMPQVEFVGVQKIHCLGLPLQASWRWLEAKSWSLYTSAGATLEIPVRATRTTECRLDGTLLNGQRESFHAPLQWSVGAGLGLQYSITPSIGLFTEPHLQYFIPTESDVETYRTEHPLNFTVPFGIRFTW